jgi:hypothetical protein
VEAGDEQTSDTEDYRDGFTIKTIYDRKDQYKLILYSVI